VSSTSITRPNCEKCFRRNARFFNSSRGTFTHSVFNTDAGIGLFPMRQDRCERQCPGKQGGADRRKRLRTQRTEHRFFHGLFCRRVELWCLLLRAAVRSKDRLLQTGCVHRDGVERARTPSRLQCKMRKKRRRRNEDEEKSEKRRTTLFITFLHGVQLSGLGGGVRVRSSSATPSRGPRFFWSIRERS
jgi:hypothetical protein